MRRIVAALLFVFSLLCCLTRPVLAQEGSATLTGFIQDSSKSVIPGVKVTAIDTNTNQRFDATTSKDGSYTIVSLPVGPYQMQIEKQGFKTILKDDLFLHTQDALEVNFQMAVGSSAETVTVNAGATNDNPAVSMTVTREFVENMPLNGRSFQDLIQLAPGTVSSQNGYYSINGQRTDSNNYTVDGVSANLGGYNNHSAGGEGSGLSGASPSQTAIGTTQSLASIDSLQEFTIQTSGYTAEYGRSPGGQVQFTTRSGTDDLHGTVFEYLRNTAFDANSYYSDYYAQPKTAEHQNDFGGTVGGPLIVPKLYNGKDKTFYFFSYEGLQLLLPAFETEYVPTQGFRNASSPNVQPFLNASPLPNPHSPANQDGCTIPDSTTGQRTACDALFTYGYSTPRNVDNISLRADQKLSQRIHAFIRYADTPSSSIGGLENVFNSTINTHIWTAGVTASITSRVLNEFRFNYSYDGEETVYTMKSVGGSLPLSRNLVIPSTDDGPYADSYYRVSISGSSLNISHQYSGIGTVQHQYELIDGFSWATRKHELKLGVDWRRLTPQFAEQLYDSNLSLTSLADIQQGYASGLTVYAGSPGKPVFDNLSLYAQDHWRANPRLSVDYGLRWEFNPPPSPSNGHYPVALTSSNLATATLTNDNTEPYKTNYHSFAPRFGFAWNAIPSQNHPLTVRGGFGIFFDTGQSAIGQAYSGAYPFQASGPSQSHVALPLSATALAPPSLSAPLTLPYPSVSEVSSPDLTLPYTEQWTLSVDEAVSAKNKLTVSYVGNNGRKLLFTQLYDGIPGNPDFTTVEITSNGSQSSYNALQVLDTGRLRSGLDLIASFTLAHGLDNISSDSSSLAPIWGNSDYDLRRVLNLALNYQTPSANWSHWIESLTHGWLLANRFSTQSGYPITNIQQAVVYLPNGSEVRYSPDLVAGVPIYLHGRAADVGGQPVPASWRLNPVAFACVPTNTGKPCSGTPTRQGTLKRNYLRNPSFYALNMALQRSFPVHEQLHLNFRVDAFNILNHPNPSGPYVGSLTSANFGQLIYANTTTIGSSNALYSMGASRSLQFSLKLEF